MFEIWAILWDFIEFHRNFKDFEGFFGIRSRFGGLSAISWDLMGIPKDFRDVLMDHFDLLEGSRRDPSEIL